MYVCPPHHLAASVCSVDGVVVLGQLIVFLNNRHNPVHNALYEALQGVPSMRVRTFDSVYWPDITVDFAQGRDQCAHCH